jgi:hypothetical protein
MRVRQLFIKVTAYYAIVTTVVFGIIALFPGFGHFLPIGGAETLLSNPADDPFQGVAIGATQVGNLAESILWLFLAAFGALLTVLPISWTYMACRDPKEYHQSLVETIVVMPILVTSIVIIVHDSLALAFSLAGIVGGVRFRNSLKSTGDALYILLAIGIGLGAGIGALEISVVMSLMFNYVFLVLWATDYGAMKGARRYLRNTRDEDVMPAEPDT